MEKRRNTLDRFQRLGFGRRSASNPPDGKTTETTKKDVKKPSDKTERLKELTEMLKGSRAPPPIPPPRRPRQHIFEKQDSIEIASTSQSNNNINYENETPLETTKSTVDDISDNLGKPPEIPTPKRDSCTNSIFDIPSACKNKLLRSLRPNTSASDLEHFILQRNSLEDSIKTPPIAPNEDDFFTNVPRAESRTIVGSYTQKSIPFRSASFSQVDYTSGKYIRSALGALKSTFLKDRTTTVVDHANLTLPRKKSRSRSTSPNPIVDHKMKEEEEEQQSLEKTDIQIIDTMNEHEEEVILEEKEIRPDNRDYDDDNENSEIQFIDRTQSSCSVDTIHEEDDLHLAEVKIASEMTLETLTEEEIPIDSMKNEDSFLQTATTCLIPVPVYECVNQDDHPWINVTDNETSPKQIEAMGISLDMMKEIKECEIGPDIIDDLCGSSHDLNSVKVIEQIFGTSEIVKVSDSSQVPESVESLDHEDDAPTTPTSEFVEVRKRHSNNQETRQEVSISPEKSSPNDPSSPSGDERMKIDKSRRRKGIYIQWPTTGKATDLNPEGTPEDDSTPEDKVPWECDKITQQDVDLDLSCCDFSAIKKPLHLSCSSKTLDGDNRKSDSQCSMEPATPDSDSSRPIWPKCPRRQSLTCQSSDEKDDPPVTASPNKPYRSLFYFKQDSISDNESDKTPPRDRSSASPAPPDQEMKRYSKRPVRGPYGQILEAEMKKPNKLNYDEVLEDLNRDK